MTIFGRPSLTIVGMSLRRVLAQLVGRPTTPPTRSLAEAVAPYLPEERGRAGKSRESEERPQRP